MLASRGCGSVGRASPCQGEGRGFESRHPLHPRSSGLRVTALRAPPEGGSTRVHGGVAEWFRQGSAKPCTPVQFRAPPPPDLYDRVSRARSSAGERFPDTEEVTGSNPVAPTTPPLTSGNAVALTIAALCSGNADQFAVWGRSRGLCTGWRPRASSAAHLLPEDHLAALYVRVEGG